MSSQLRTYEQSMQNPSQKHHTPHFNILFGRLLKTEFRSPSTELRANGRQLVFNHDFPFMLSLVEAFRTRFRSTIPRCGNRSSSDARMRYLGELGEILRSNHLASVLPSFSGPNL